MSPQRVTRLSETWTELVNKYLGSSAQTYPIIESLAPFQYYVQQNRLPGGPSGIHPTVSIDIGGGTTDVAILQSQLPVLFTSFKYAANVIFGDGYGQNGADTNSMIRKYAKQYSELLRTNGLYNPARVFSDLLESGRSEDINAFLFSLENHRGIPDPGLFSYAKRLSKDDELKIVFLYFYSSLVYSIADTMHKKGFDFPKCLTFSGTGSKMLSIITSDMALLNRFTGKIFEYVYQRQLPEDRTLVVETERDYPKEVTCKGGLYWATRDQKTFDVSSIKYTNTGIEGTDKLTYGMIDGSMRHSVVAGVQRFNEMFLAIGRSIDFTDYFGISPTSIDIFKRECNKHLDDFLIEGIEAHKKDEQISFDDREIDETLFFYPLKGVVNSLVNNLASE
jgi:hypothetical protein